MRKLILLSVAALLLTIALAAPSAAQLPLCSCPYCEGSEELQCLTSNGTQISCALYLFLAACPQG